MHLSCCCCVLTSHIDCTLYRDAKKDSGKPTTTSTKPKDDKPKDVKPKDVKPKVTEEAKKTPEATKKPEAKKTDDAKKPEAKKPKDTGKKPEFTQKLKDLEGTTGKSARFECKVKGEPTPDVKWYVINSVI